MKLLCELLNDPQSKPEKLHTNKYLTIKLLTHNLTSKTARNEIDFQCKHWKAVNLNIPIPVGRDAASLYE